MGQFRSHNTSHHTQIVNLDLESHLVTQKCGVNTRDVTKMKSKNGDNWKTQHATLKGTKKRERWWSWDCFYGGKNHELIRGSPAFIKLFICKY